MSSKNHKLVEGLVTAGGTGRLPGRFPSSFRSVVYRVWFESTRSSEMKTY